MKIIADNLQITRFGSGRRPLSTGTRMRFQVLVQAMEAAGAEAIDLNTGPLGRNAAHGNGVLR